MIEKMIEMIGKFTIISDYCYYVSNDNKLWK